MWKPFLVILLLTFHTFNGEELYVDEIGDNDIISIESDVLEPIKIVKRDTEKAEPSYNYDYDDGDQAESSGDMIDDLDDSYEMDDDDSDQDRLMPTRVVPSLISPSFEDPGFGQMVTKPASPKKSAFDLIKTSLYDEIEGSGQDDYEDLASIQPTKVTTNMIKTKLPEFSPTFETTGMTDGGARQPVINSSPPTSSINQSPFVNKKLRKHAVVNGQSLKFKIPEETFIDPEDGNTRNMRVDVLQENNTPLRVPWLKYDPSIQTIFALPFDENGIGRYTFNIVATDSKGLNATDQLEIVVRQYPGARLVNHQFKIEFSFTKLQNRKGWEWDMLYKIRTLYGDFNSDNILVRTIAENPFVFTWTNESLHQQTCQQTEIRKLFSKLIEGENTAYKTTYGTASSALKDVLGEEFFVKSVSMNYLGTCLMDDNLTKGKPNLSNGKEDSVPVIRNPIDRLEVTAGELLRYRVPEDTCYDPEDGQTSRLNLHLLTTNRRELSPEAWLQFDDKNQEFVGIPLEEEVGREEYQLVCSDANGLSAIDGIEVIVGHRDFNERFGVEFSLKFGANDYGSGMDTIQAFGQPILRRDMKVRIVEQLANYFGDKSTLNIILRDFDPDNGRVVWNNKSLAQLPCDSPNVLWVKSKLLDSQGKVVKDLIRHFQPYLRLVDANVVMQGHCIAGKIPPVPTSGSPEDSPFDTDRIFHGLLPNSDYLLTFIIPAVIITCMLILAILLACMLHKKRKAGKLNLFYSEALPPRVPVILQDELFDEHDVMGNGGNKQPVLLREDLMNGGAIHHQGHGGSLLRENEALLQQQQRPIQIDPYGRGSLGRPTPAYQRRQL